MLNEIFSDYFAHKDNLLTRIDTRIKMFFVFGAIFISLFSRTSAIPLIIAFLSLFFLLAIRIPPKVILIRLSMPLSMGVVILFIHIFFFGYKEGLFRGLLIIGKVIGCTSLIIFLSMTTPVNKLLSASLWFRVPKIFIEITMITYRYVFVLIENAITIRDAQKIRLGYSSLPRSVRSLAELAGSVFIRAYDQSISTYEAMRLRGYSGTNKVFLKEKFKPRDGLCLIILSIILAGLLILNIYWR